MSERAALPPRPVALAVTSIDRETAARVALALAIVLSALPVIGVPLPEALVTVPDAFVLPWRDWAGDALTFVAKDATIGGIALGDLTRGFAAILLWPMEVLQGILSRGVEVGGLEIPSLPWVSVLLLAALLGFRLGGWRLATLAGGALLYPALFDLWDPAMLTLASVAVSVALGVAVGIGLGVAAFRSPRVDRALQPVYDCMQTVPVFAYLVPILFLFGFGPVGAMMATVIYAMPPMARVATVALRAVPPEIGEAARIAGATRGQTMRLALLPSARHQLLVGVNQVVMLSLTMVIIASVIGADGLGAIVLQSLQSLRIGRGLEAGVAIVLIAIALDRLTQATARTDGLRRRPALPGGRLLFPLAVAAAVLGPALLSLVAEPVARLPREMALSTAAWWDAWVADLNRATADLMREIKVIVFTWLLIPVRTFFLSLPWVGAVAFVAALGALLGGWRLSLAAAAMMVFVAACGFWQAAQLTLYLVSLSVILSLAIGMPIGVLASAHPRLDRAVTVVLDTIQTLPTFVYLIPVIMILGTGDFPALVAIVIYAVTPAVRYTADALRHVPPEIVEAAKMAGATRAQTFFAVRVPVARPGLLLAVNQTVMMAFGMLVITALIGTRGLERDTLISLSKADPGRGIVAGVAMAFLAIIFDRFLRAAARDRRARDGAP